MASLTRTDIWPVGQRSMGREEVRAHTDQLFAVCPSGDSVCGTVSISTDYYTRSVRQCQSCCGRRWWVWVQVRACERAETCGGNSSWRSSWVSTVLQYNITREVILCINPTYGYVRCLCITRYLHQGTIN